MGETRGLIQEKDPDLLFSFLTLNLSQNFAPSERYYSSIVNLDRSIDLKTYITLLSMIDILIKRNLLSCTNSALE